MKIDQILEFYHSHRGGLNGAFIGLMISVSILALGLFRTMFIAIFVVLGYYIGKNISADKDYIKNLLDRILPPGTYR